MGEKISSIVNCQKYANTDVGRAADAAHPHRRNRGHKEARIGAERPPPARAELQDIELQAISQRVSQAICNRSAGQRSAPGQKRPKGHVPVASGLPRNCGHWLAWQAGLFRAITDLVRRSRRLLGVGGYSITSSACPSTSGKFEAELPGGLGVDHELELCRQHNRQITRLLAFEDTSCINADLTVCIGNAGPVAHQAAGSDGFARGIDRRNAVSGRQRAQTVSVGRTRTRRCPRAARQPQIWTRSTAFRRCPTVEQGAGEPIVFVHGAFSDLRVWEPIREEVAKRYRFIAYTQRYFGTDPWPDDGKNFNIETHADDLAKFITSLNAGPVHVVTRSRGGGVAMAAALKIWCWPLSDPHPA